MVRGDVEWVDLLFVAGGSGSNKNNAMTQNKVDTEAVGSSWPTSEFSDVRLQLSGSFLWVGVI